MTELGTIRAFRRLQSEGRTLRRTPDWIEPLPAEKRQEGTEDLSMPLSQNQFKLENRTERTIIRSQDQQSRTKTKTRGTAIQPDPTTATAPATDTTAQTLFTVDKRAHKVFLTLFYQPSRSSQPGEIPWTDSLHAMGMVGFSTEQLYGSVWQFTPTTRLNIERGIQFHEPHPVGKIPFRMARRHGRRLARAYGWHASMFKLAG